MSVLVSDGALAYIYKVLILNSKNSKRNDKSVFTLISIINSTNKSRSWLKGTKYKIELKTKLSTNVMGEYQNHCKWLGISSLSDNYKRVKDIQTLLMSSIRQGYACWRIKLVPDDHK